MNEPNPPRRMLRSIGAVFAGFLVVVVLSTVTDLVMHATGVFPKPGQPMSDALWLLATAYRVGFTVAAGYLTARLAPYRPMSHAVALGVVGLAAGTAGAVATWGGGPEFGPKWYSLGLVVTALPSCWAGGKLFGGASSDHDVRNAS